MRWSHVPYEPRDRDHHDPREERTYDAPVDRVSSLFERYVQDDDVEVPGDLPVDAVNTLPLLVNHDTAEWGQVGRFLTEGYNAVDADHITYNTATTAPLSELGKELEQDVELVVSQPTEDLGRISQGTIINHDEVQSSFGHSGDGVYVNTGTVNGDMGTHSFGQHINYGTVHGDLGGDGRGIFINYGDVNGAMGNGHGLFVNYGSVESIAPRSYISDGGVVINAGTVRNDYEDWEDGRGTADILVDVTQDVTDIVDRSCADLVIGTAVLDRRPRLERYVSSVVEDLGSAGRYDADRERFPPLFDPKLGELAHVRYLLRLTNDLRESIDDDPRDSDLPVHPVDTLRIDIGQLYWEDAPQAYRDSIYEDITTGTITNMEKPELVDRYMAMKTEEDHDDGR